MKRCIPALLPLFEFLRAVHGSIGYGYYGGYRHYGRYGFGGHGGWGRGWRH